MPAESVTRLLSRPVANECTVTCAPGTTAPVGSVTVPFRLAADWPNAVAAKNINTDASAMDFIHFITASKRKTMYV